MATTFKKELKSLANNAICRSERDMRDSLKKAHGALGKTLTKRKDSSERLVFSLQQAIDAAIAHNCGVFVKETLDSWSGKILEDIEIPTSKTRQDELFDVIQEKHKTGFVYIAWRHKPYKYFYVGKAAPGKTGEVKRVNRFHGKLMSSWSKGKATRFALVKPSKCTNPRLHNLETSIILIYKFLTGSYPVFNDASVSAGIPTGPLTNDLMLIKRTFLSASSAIEKHLQKQKSRAEKLKKRFDNTNETDEISDTNDITCNQESVNETETNQTGPQDVEEKSSFFKKVYS
jgi:hypothetical protein